MTAAELWVSMSKGYSVAILSPRQRDYLIDLAKAEKIFDVNSTTVTFKDGKRVSIREAKVKVGGYGGTIGTRSTGNFRAVEQYLIEFEDTKLQGILHALPASKAGFPFGFPCAVYYLKRGYIGQTKIELLDLSAGVVKKDVTQSSLWNTSPSIA